MKFMFQEYPKWVAGMIVHSAKEEAALMPKDHATPPSSTTPATTENLIIAAEAIGIKVDKRWSDKRLSEEISKAK